MRRRKTGFVDQREIRDGGRPLGMGAGGDPMDAPEAAENQIARLCPGEYRLYRAVLEDAIRLLQRPPANVPPQVLQDTRAWLASDDRSWPCAFVCVCEWLGVDPAYIRRQVIRLAARDGHVLPFSRGVDNRKGWRWRAEA